MNESVIGKRLRLTMKARASILATQDEFESSFLRDLLDGKDAEIVNVVAKGDGETFYYVGRTGFLLMPAAAFERPVDNAGVDIRRATPKAVLGGIEDGHTRRPFLFNRSVDSALPDDGNLTTEDWRAIALHLFGLLDEIDTASDIAKTDARVYRNLVLASQKKRFEVADTDGYDVAFKKPEKGNGL